MYSFFSRESLLSHSGFWDLSWPVYVGHIGRAFPREPFESFGILGFQLAGICGAYWYLLSGGCGGGGGGDVAEDEEKETQF